MTTTGVRLPDADTDPDAARRRSGRRSGRVGLSVGITAALLVLTSCTPTADEPEVRPNELADAGGRPCPGELPVGDDPSGHGFGIEQVAKESPTLLEPQQAWVCQYVTFDAGNTAGGGVVFGWQLAGQPTPVPAADLPRLKTALDDLAPAHRSRGCTSDLGPRWMVVYSSDGDLTGVVVDDYGCRDVRLTDNPHLTPPGADHQEGTVGGVLDGGAAILEALGVGRSG